MDCSFKLQKSVGGDHAVLVGWLNQNLVAELQCWELVRQRGGSFTNNLVPNKALDFRGRWEILKSPVEGNVSVPEVDKKRRLVFRIRKPIGGPREPKLYAWVVTLRPSRGACDKLIPPDYTTSDDSAPESADRILNRRPMIGTVATGTYVLGRVLAITEWR